MNLTEALNEAYDALDEVYNSTQDYWSNLKDEETEELATTQHNLRTLMEAMTMIHALSEFSDKGHIHLTIDG